MIPEHYTSLTPFICVAGAERALAFYTSVFGAELVERTDNPDGSVAHAELDFGCGRLQLGEPSAQFRTAAPDPGDDTVTYSLGLYCADVDAVLARAEAAGATVREPAQTFVTGGAGLGRGTPPPAGRVVGRQPVAPARTPTRLPHAPSCARDRVGTPTRANAVARPGVSAYRHGPSRCGKRPSAKGRRMGAMSCVFCAIVAGEVPAIRIHEDDGYLAFLDIRPFSRGHTLVVPKRHSRDLTDTPPDTLAGMITLGQRIARAARVSGLHADGNNLVINDGRAAFQTVFHIHLHVVPRRDGDRLSFAKGVVLRRDPDREESGRLLREALARLDEAAHD